MHKRFLAALGMTRRMGQHMDFSASLEIGAKTAERVLTDLSSLHWYFERSREIHFFVKHAVIPSAARDLLRRSSQ